MMQARRAVARSRRTSRGFTLLEAIIVITLTGVVAAVVGVFIRQPINAYVEQVRRAELGDAAEASLRRITREVQQALPNSVRVVAVDPTHSVLEFVPVTASGRYRAAPDAMGHGDFLDFESATDGSFAVLGPGVDVVAGDQLAIHNRGVPGADAYSGETRRVLTSIGAGLTTLTYAIGTGQFPSASPSKRFQITAAPVTYLCAAAANGGGSLRRYTGYAIQSKQPTDAGAAPLAALSGRSNALLADRVAACAFGYGPGAAGNGVLTISLTLSSGGERVTLVVQAQIDNSP